MKLKQISIFIENRSGRLAKITGVLGRAGVNIRAMALADTSDFGILRLIVNDPDTAVTALKDNGFTVRVSEVIAVQINDRPGELGKFLEIIEKGGLNVEYMYAFVQKSSVNAVIIFNFDDLDRAITTIQSAGMTILEKNTVLNM